MKIRSLSNRLLLLSMGWTIISLALILGFVANDYRETSQRAFNELLSANLYNLMGSVQLNKEGKLSGHPDLGDPRFIAVNSGWYWQVIQVGKPENRLASASLVDREITAENAPSFNVQYQRSYPAIDIAGHHLLVIEARAFLGEGDRLFSFRVAGNENKLNEDTRAFTVRLAWMFILFGLGLAAMSFVVVRFGLAPLKNTTAKLAAVRNGEAEELEGSFPLEIEPLINETNELIRSNRRVVERARTQVGNLAHGLKTPLAVIRNEVHGKNIDGSVIASQAGKMQAQIQSYLDRARISSQHSTAISRTGVKPVLEGITRVISKLNPDLAISCETSPQGLTFAGESQDFEELVGNLMENAARFAKSRILITGTADGEQRMVLTVEDDGRGMSEEEASKAMQRGTRIDETTPGSGLGLAIVCDIASQYKGSVTLERATLGGLRASVTLPARD